MSLSGSICLLFLVLLTGVRGRSTGSCISFPAYVAKPGATDEGQYDSATIRRRYPEGIGAVRSISNIVLNVLDREEVRSSPKNWVVSPLSLTIILAQLLLGSRGHLQSVLTDSLSLRNGIKPTSRLEIHRQLGRLMNYLQRSANHSYILDLNSAVFLQPEILLKPTYKHALLDFYNAHIYVVDFLRRSGASTNRINEWVKESTHGKLPEVYTYPLPPSTVSVMVNAVYFNGRWENPFTPDYTSIGQFFVTPTQPVNVSFMFGPKEVLYKNSSDFQLIGIPYKNREVVLYVLLPHDELQTSLRLDRLDQLISTAELDMITLSMPKLKILSTISVRQSVLKYLMKSSRLASRSVILGEDRGVSTRLQPPFEYDDSNDFDVSGASEDSRFRFDEVIHQVSMEIDEKGSEIAAVSSTLIDYSGDNFLLKINRPFWFFVRHEPSSTHLFWGRIVNPLGERKRNLYNI